MADSPTPENTNVTPEAAPAPSAPPPTAGSSQEVPSAFSLFKPSWEGLKLNLLELIVIYAVPSAILALLFLVGASMASSSGSGAVVLIGLGVLAALVYATLLGPAIIHIQLKSARMEKATYESAWATSKKFWWRFLLLSIAVGFVIAIGLLLLIVPGIIFIRRYFLSQYALIDQDLDVGDSMRASNELSRGRSMAVFGILGVDILIGIPSFIPIIGQIITFLLQIGYFCAPAIRYQQLKGLKPAAAKSAV